MFGRLIYVIWLVFICSSLVNAQDWCELPALEQNTVFFDSATIRQFPAYFPDCMEGVEGYLLCWPEQADVDAKLPRFSGDGRVKEHHVHLSTWKRDSFPEIQIGISNDLKSVIARQQSFLRHRRKAHSLDGTASFSDTDLRKTLKQLKADIESGQTLKSSHYDAFRLNGFDGRGNVQFTAYFTPVIHVRRYPDEEHRFALYKRPSTWESSGVYFSRKQIDKDRLLAGLGLEIAFTKNPLDIFTMQVQGSGLAVFEDGSKRLLAFDGKNGHPYVSIGRLLVEDGHISAANISLKTISDWFNKNPDQLEHYLFQNPAYVFFRPKGREPTGATGLSLTAGHSIAVDPAVIPYGSVLLARMPILDENHRLSRHEWRLLFPQDTGAAIKGPGHIDLYMGIGEEAKRKASALHHFGEVWLLLGRR